MTGIVLIRTTGSAGIDMNKQSALQWVSSAGRSEAASLLAKRGIAVSFHRKWSSSLAALERNLPLFIEAGSADDLGERLTAAERAGFHGAAIAPFPGKAWMIAFFGETQGSAVLRPSAAALPPWAWEGPLFLGALALYGTGLFPSVLAGADWLRAERGGME